MRDRLRNLLKSAWQNLSLTKRFHLETSGNVTLLPHTMYDHPIHTPLSQFSIPFHEPWAYVAAKCGYQLIMTCQHSKVTKSGQYDHL